MDMQLNDSNHEEPEWLKELEENYRRTYFNKEDYKRFFTNVDSPSIRKQQQQQQQTDQQPPQNSHIDTFQQPYEEAITFAPKADFYNPTGPQQQPHQNQQQYNYEPEQHYYNPQQQQQQPSYENYHQETLLISNDASYKAPQPDHQQIGQQPSQGFSYGNNYGANNGYENSAQPPIDNVSV